MKSVAAANVAWAACKGAPMFKVPLIKLSTLPLRNFLAKVMVSRMAVVVWILSARQVLWLYEQPSSSLLWEHPRMQQILKSLSVYRAHTWMGAFGGKSPKGTFLWSPSPSVQKYSRVLPHKEWTADMVRRSKNGSITGSKDLKASQCYSREFGLTTVSVWLEEKPQPEFDLTGVTIPDIWAPLTPQNQWRDAKLTGVMQRLSVGDL